jgi:hypothetical protein
MNEELISRLEEDVKSAETRLEETRAWVEKLRTMLEAVRKHPEPVGEGASEAGGSVGREAGGGEMSYENDYKRVQINLPPLSFEYEMRYITNVDGRAVEEMLAYVEREVRKQIWQQTDIKPVGLPYLHSQPTQQTPFKVVGVDFLTLDEPIKDVPQEPEDSPTELQDVLSYVGEQVQKKEEQQQLKDDYDRAMKHVRFMA